MEWLQRTKKCNSRLKTYIGDTACGRMTVWEIKSIKNKCNILQEYEGRVQRD